MPNIRDRVKVQITTTGTNDIQLTTNNSVTGFRGFRDAYQKSALVSYVIEDGASWEVGTGSYSYGDNLFYRVPTSSSTGGGKINLSGNATLAVAYLSSDNVADWPYFEIATSSSPADQTQGYFPTLVFNHDNPTTDTHSAYNTFSGYYTVPDSGVYDIVLKFRLADYTPGGLSYGIGVDVANNDTPNFSWYESGPAMRKGAIYRRVSRFGQADQLRAFCYVDGTASLVASALTIFRVR